MWRWKLPEGSHRGAGPPGSGRGRSVGRDRPVQVSWGRTPAAAAASSSDGTTEGTEEPS